MFDHHIKTWAMITLGDAYAGAKKQYDASMHGYYAACETADQYKRHADFWREIAGRGSLIAREFDALCFKWERIIIRWEGKVATRQRECKQAYTIWARYRPIWLGW